MQFLDIDNWNRKEHYEFFSRMEEPFFGICLEVEVTKAYDFCKTNGISFFIYSHYLSTKAVNEIEAFKYRIAEKQVVIYDMIHVNTIVIRKDTSFCFTYMQYTPDFKMFEQGALKAMAQVAHTSGIGLEDNTSRPDTIHYSTIPWIKFTGLTHARSYSFPDSVPKISFGKIVQEGNQRKMPLAIYVHHGLMDAYHVGLYVDCFQELMNR